MELFNTYSLGEHLLPAIVNADYSILPDEEAAELNAWIKSITTAVAQELEISYEEARAATYLECGNAEHFTRCAVSNFYSTCHPVHVYIHIEL